MENQEKKYLICVVGPTAVGKTACAILLAKHFGSEIISLDSRQFYKELSIGTAKPSEDELKSVKHHFINNLSIHTEYNVNDFEKEALQLLEHLFSKKNIVVAVGGSGLFHRALCYGFDKIPDIDVSVREKIIEIYNNEGLEIILKELQEKDPKMYDEIDKNNHQRIIRALEVCRGTGVPFSNFRTGNKIKRGFEIINIGLEMDRIELYEKIDSRMEKMINDGLFEEAKFLYQFKDKNALQTVGYKEIFDFMDETYDKNECVRLLKRNSRHYAKRQMTWFKKDDSVNWFNVSVFESKEKLINAILLSLKLDLTSKVRD